MSRVAFLCCHLSGTGHLVRIGALARAAEAAGATVRVLSGGRPLAYLAEPVPGLVQLPPLTVQNFDFSTLCDVAGNPVDSAYLAARQAALAEAITAFKPDVLVTELFPLGRRRLAGEFEAAIAAARKARPGCAIAASVRDVPEPPKKPARVAAAAARLRELFDLLLVHGDAGFLPLEASWPLPEDLRAKVTYTGYVGHEGQKTSDYQSDTILVATGGGALGAALVGLIPEASRISARPWHVLAGGMTAPEIAAFSAAHAHTGLTVEAPRADYRHLLGAAACSVSLAGYNTAMDLAACDTPAVLVPFAEKGEQEQSIRAKALAAFPGVEVLAADTLTPALLAATADRMASGPRRPPLPIARDGAAKSARALLDLARRTSHA